MKSQRPKFVPKLGQTDYTNVRRAPVINCIVKFGDKILLVERAMSLHFYPCHWNGISGFLDDNKSVVEKAREEIKEELGFEMSEILSIKEGKTFEQKDKKYDKVWVVHPVLVEVNTDKIALDWEAESYVWVKVEEAFGYELVPGFDHVLATFFGKI